MLCYLLTPLCPVVIWAYHNTKRGGGFWWVDFGMLPIVRYTGSVVLLWKRVSWVLSDDRYYNEDHSHARMLWFIESLLHSVSIKIDLRRYTCAPIQPTTSHQCASHCRCGTFTQGPGSGILVCKLQLTHKFRITIEGLNTLHCALPSVYNKGAPARGKATPCTPTNSGSTWLLQAQKYHK